MKRFIGNNFLLNTETAKTLYHVYAKRLPILDYHCHVSPKEIAENRHYANITELWLGSDHYKWRAMRSCGISERYITGDASDYEKFHAWASCLPFLIGNPLYAWSHLELKNYFNCSLPLSEDTCDEIWTLCNERLHREDFGVRDIIATSGVEVICTTDDPCDDLAYHDQLAFDDSFTTRVYPAFRPDKGLNIEREGFRSYIDRLSAISGVTITGMDSLKEAFRVRLDYFEAHGCRTADHGIDNTVFFMLPDMPSHPDTIFKKVYLEGQNPTAREEEIFKTEMLRFFGKEYRRRGWVMQLHFGVLRNANTRMFRDLGTDTGFDVIDGRGGMVKLAGLLDLLDASEALPKTILYSINPSDNASVGALIGAFQNDSVDGLPRLYQGSAWWFSDNRRGMEDQMTSLANLSAFGRFPGMLTDSRSFLSYTRHEYFRRILCNLIGNWVEQGEYPCDMTRLAQLVMDICYNNTKKLFGF